MKKILDKYAAENPVVQRPYLRNAVEDNIVDSDEMDDLLFKDFNLLEKYGTHKTSTFYYEMTCFDERLRNSEINEKIKELDALPKRNEMLSLYWQSYRNERHKFLAVKKYLLGKFMELKKRQTTETLPKFNKKWKKCEEIVENHFTKQHEHVNDVFYSFITRNNVTKDEFKGIIENIRASWDDVTHKAKDECIAFMEVPIPQEVKQRKDSKPTKGLSYWEKFNFKGFFN